jgi:hypothetical protein
MVSPTLKLADIAGALQGNATDDGSSFSTGSLSEQNFLQNQRLATKPWKLKRRNSLVSSQLGSQVLFWKSKSQHPISAP